MYRFLAIFSCLISLTVYSQTAEKADPHSQVNAEEQAMGLPGASAGSPYSVTKTKKRTIKVPPVIAPTENTLPANCADSLGGKGSATFTACEAGKKTR